MTVDSGPRFPAKKNALSFLLILFVDPYIPGPFVFVHVAVSIIEQDFDF